MQIQAVQYKVNCLDFPCIRYSLYKDKVIDICINREILPGLGELQQY